MAVRTVQAVNHQIEQKENFDSFLYRFDIDSAFQISRIKFPLKTSYLVETNEVKSIEIAREEWNVRRQLRHFDAKPQVYDNFSRKIGIQGNGCFVWKVGERGFSSNINSS